MRHEEFNQQLCFNAQGQNTEFFYDQQKPEALHDMPTEDKKTGILGNILRRSSDKSVEKKDVRRNSKSSSGGLFNIFAKKSSDDLRRSQGTPEVSRKASQGTPEVRRRSRELEEQGKEAFVARLKEDGVSEEEIAEIIAQIAQETAASTSVSSPSPRKKGVTSWLSSMHQALKDEFGVRRDDYLPAYYVQPDILAEARDMRIQISAAPFWAAPPPETDMTFAEFATFEPIYTGNGLCVNTLAVHKHDGKALPGDQKTCPVCVEDYQKKDELKCLPCGHYHHKECLDRWLMVGHKCPVCKWFIQ